MEISMKKGVQKHFLVTVLVIFVALFVMLAYTFHSFYVNSTEQIEELGKSNLDREAARIEAYINRGMDVLWVTADTVNGMMEDGDSNEDILRYLTTEAKHQTEQVDENFTGIYGWINGEYLDGIGWVPDDDYVATSRDWYVTGLEGNGLPVIVAPYLDAQTNTVMISVSQMLSDGVSVLSLDITLNEIQNITESINMNDMGYGFIIDDTGLVVAHMHEDQKGQVYPLNEEQNRMITSIHSTEQGSFVTDVDGERCTVFSQRILDSWYVVMIVNNSKLFREARIQIAFNVFTCLIVFSVILIFCGFAYRKMGEHEKRDNESRLKLDRLNSNVVRALAYTIDAKDRYTSGHSQRVAAYSVEIAKRMGKSEDEQKVIYQAGLLHDVGKIRIPENVINKPGKLTDDEFNIIKMHPVSGYHILKGIYDDNRVSFGAKYHHERYDGTGYPNGLSGENIPEVARIIGVADAYDAMASNRSYRNALPQSVVRGEIEKGRGIQFDPYIADIMLEMIDEDVTYAMRQMEVPTKSILVVDDDEMNHKMLEFILKDEPTYSLVHAYSGNEALEMLGTTQVDLILLDLLMPDMDGFEVFLAVRGKYSVPVVVMTADKNLDTISKVEQMGIDDYIAKPFLPIAVKETVHGILSSWS
jgi:putative nucleotidyltransferase with HDIG domain